MDLNPKYWYINEEGKIEKLIYCKLCHAGPFKLWDNKLLFDFFGLGNRDPYCKKCSSAHRGFESSTSQEKPERSRNTLKSEITVEPKEPGTPELD